MKLGHLLGRMVMLRTQLGDVRGELSQVGWTTVSIVDHDGDTAIVRRRLIDAVYYGNTFDQEPIRTSSAAIQEVLGEAFEKLRAKARAEARGPAIPPDEQEQLLREAEPAG